MELKWSGVNTTADQFKTRQGIIDKKSGPFEDRNGNPCFTFLTKDGYRTAVNYTIKPLRG